MAHKIILKRSGEVTIDGKVVGTYAVRHPRKEFGRGYVTTMWDFKGVGGRFADYSIYTRKELIDYLKKRI